MNAEWGMRGKMNMLTDFDELIDKVQADLILKQKQSKISLPLIWLLMDSQYSCYLPPEERTYVDGREWTIG